MAEKLKHAPIQLYFIVAVMLFILYFQEIVPNWQDQGSISLRPTLPAARQSLTHFGSSSNIKKKLDPCLGRKIFIHNLPERFNLGLVQKCKFKLVPWLDFCNHAANSGFGSPDEDLGSGWYDTDSYMLELIFHSRMLDYACLTNNTDAADAFYVPYYAGIDALNYLYNASSNRGQHGADMVAWILENEGDVFSRRNGADHFMVLGRTSWDFSTADPGMAPWGTSLLHLPHVMNMTKILIEKNPWMSNEKAVPYPTFFHPSSEDLTNWLDKVARSPRPYLFSFAGGIRPHQNDSIRDMLLDQCSKSSSCLQVDCSKLRCGHNPKPIITSFLQANFCLQPRGDTPTRRSSFDSFISGCIPVFFHQDSAYSQYKWHLPQDRGNYSVFVDEEEIRDGILLENILSLIPPNRIQQMRMNIISMIPSLIYMNKSDQQFADAFDITVARLLQHISSSYSDIF